MNAKLTMCDYGNTWTYQWSYYSSLSRESKADPSDESNAWHAALAAPARGKTWHFRGKHSWGVCKYEFLLPLFYFRKWKYNDCVCGTKFRRWIRNVCQPELRYKTISSVANPRIDTNQLDLINRQNVCQKSMPFSRLSPSDVSLQVRGMFGFFRRQRFSHYLRRDKYRLQVSLYLTSGVLHCTVTYSKTFVFIKTMKQVSYGSKVTLTKIVFHFIMF